MLLLSDFNLEVFSAYLRNDEESPTVVARCAPFGQLMPTLLDAKMDCWHPTPAHAFIWTRPEQVIPSFNRLLNWEPVDVDHILSEVDSFSKLLESLGQRTKNIFVATWVLSRNQRGRGAMAMSNGVGTTNILMRMNLRLADNLDRLPNIHLLDAQVWMETAGERAFNTKLWYLSKVPFSNEVFRAATGQLKSLLKGRAGESRKLVICDLDQTLWGGIVGDVGWEGLTLGGHDATGEALVDFQSALKALKNRGILLAIVSKNTESIAMEAIEKHPEMVLRAEDFVGWKINWRDKAENILELVTELNLGLSSAVFIDDSPVERARVRQALPEVFVPDWPTNKMMYKSALLDLTCFDTPSITQEDRDKTRMYQAERRRSLASRQVQSLDEWLNSLELCVVGEALSQTNVQRATQLLNKTNQMNLSTRRMSESELINWARSPDHHVWVFRVSDKFGDSGLTGMVSLAREENQARIVDFVLSCRVMGRRIEDAMLHCVVTFARSMSLERIYAQYLATERNQPCLAFWKESHFTSERESTRFAWSLGQVYPLPAAIHVEWPQGHAEPYPKQNLTAAEVGPV